MYNTIPSNISSSGVNFLSCKINNVLLTVDPNFGNSYSWKDVFELCGALDMEFKNQTFVRVIKDYRKRFFDGNDRVMFDKSTAAKVKKNLTINVCCVKVTVRWISII